MDVKKDIKSMPAAIAAIRDLRTQMDVLQDQIEKNQYDFQLSFSNVFVIIILLFEQMQAEGNGREFNQIVCQR
jgi:hypothetical protein